MSWPLSYAEPVFRPPSEAGSLILQLTVGCSWNRCTYCGMYRMKQFRVRPVEEVVAEVRAVAPLSSRARRVFLGDGDALAAPPEVLEEVLQAVRDYLPWITRVGIYADSRAIRRRARELPRLRELGLGIVYFGAESGDDETLRSVLKGATVASQLEACRLVLESGLKLSVMVLLGLAGVEGSRRHAMATGRFLVEAAPTYAAALVVTPVPGTELGDAIAAGRFEEVDRWGSLQELAWMLESMEGYRGPFHANHASNWLPLKLRLPRDREPALDLLREALASRNQDLLVPAFSRGL
ncbi:MAG: B12-binding domain-containing radical SAM protein [Acidobacteria bacterium]|nr:B12-binding domain-containing radical SAM protein [Acidobacteriota bacterium]